MTFQILNHPDVAGSISMLEAWIESKLVYSGLPGLSFGIVYDQELIWTRGFGYSDVENKVPTTPQTVYRIASISKLFTATAIMQLRDAGKLRLSDPVAEHLPWFRIRSSFADAPAITIEHLLTHTSGLPRESPFPYWNDGVFPSREQLIAALPEQEAIFPPETQWKYSNLALTVAGEIVAAVSGQTFVDYMNEHVLGPLGVTSTSITPDAHTPQLATPYGRRMPDGTRTIRPFNSLDGLLPAGNLASTVEDLARFASLQFRDGPAGGAQLLKGSTLREMHRVHWLNPDWQSGWGLGFVVRRRGESTLIEHGGSLPGYRTRLSIIPADKLAFIAFTNADDGDSASFIEQALTLVAPALRKATAPAPQTHTPDPAWERYLGLYRNPWSDTQVLIASGRLAMIAPDALDPQSSLLYLNPVAEHTFRMEGSDGYASLGELVVFELGNDGKVARVKVGENWTYPEGCETGDTRRETRDEGGRPQ